MSNHYQYDYNLLKNEKPKIINLYLNKFGHFPLWNEKHYK
jgi:hypothetical protein